MIKFSDYLEVHASPKPIFKTVTTSVEVIK